VHSDLVTACFANSVRDKPIYGTTMVLASSVKRGWSLSVTQKKRAFSSDRLLTYLGLIISQLDSKDPSYFKDYGTGGRRNRKF